MSLLLDALKRAELLKQRTQSSADNVAGRIPDIDFTAIDPATIERRHAKNLFNAKHAGYNSYDQAKLIAALGATALLLGAAGFYAWYWYNTAFPPASQISLNSRPPAAATTGTENSAPPVAKAAMPTDAPTAVPATAAEAAPTPPPVAQATTPNKNNPAMALATPTTKTKEPNKALRVVKPKPLPTASALPTKPAATVAKAPVMITAPTAAPVVAAPSNNDSNIRLRRSNEEIFAINPDLGAAYQALAAGRLAEARQKYEMVLQKDPANIDAELGLATIAAKNNEQAEAARRYKRVLELNPKNAYALAGNAALLNDQPQTENQLRAQVAQQPQSAPLAAAMGNVFASQGRWNEAQQAYFDAVRLDGNNPDYVFNLAVSLDQIGQPKLALENYQKALQLANVRPSQFSKEAIATRIAELSRNK